MKKIIEFGTCWECENLDLLAPITREGMQILLSDGTREIYWNNEIPPYALASEEEKKDFYRKNGYLFIGDEVKIIKGRKLPMGEKKIIKSFYDYTVPGTYGHQGTTYIRFTDNTSTSINNIEPTCELNPDINYFFEFKSSWSVGGRV